MYLVVSRTQAKICLEHGDKGTNNFRITVTLQPSQTLAWALEHVSKYFISEKVNCTTLWMLLNENEPR